MKIRAYNILIVILQAVCIWTLEEIRQGKVSSKGQWRKFPESVCFTIFWGTEFQLESLTFAGKSTSVDTLIPLRQGHYGNNCL